jgi:hypothetical protein
MIPGPVYTLSPAGELEFCNRQILDCFGRTMEELRDWAPWSTPTTWISWPSSTAVSQPDNRSTSSNPTHDLPGADLDPRDAAICFKLPVRSTP